MKVTEIVAKPVVQPPNRYTIELDQEDFRLLRLICGNASQNAVRNYLNTHRSNLDVSKSAKLLADLYRAMAYEKRVVEQ